MNASSVGLLIALIALLNLGAWAAVLGYLRLKYPAPPELREPDAPRAADSLFPGYYLVTYRVVNEREAGRFLGWGSLMRGNGAMYLTGRGLHFLRHLTRRPLWIPNAALRRVNVQLSPRRRIKGRMSLEVDWELAGLRLRSVFVLTGGVSATVHLAQRLEARLPAQ
jgi:hypothetical protein